MKSIIFIKENMFLPIIVILCLFKMHCCKAANQTTLHHASATYSSIMVMPSTMVNLIASSTNFEITPVTTITSYTGINFNNTYQSSSSTSLYISQSHSIIAHVTSKEYIYSTSNTTKFTDKSISTYTPTQSTSQLPSKSTTVLHKVGLIIGVVCGLVTLSLCLIIFHKKEARLRCLKLMCKPCTKNYSKYNIVPIYVYDDVEQDIRELQDDSDLPLV